MPGRSNLGWTAPEILEQGERPNYKTDVFSFAMVMLEVCCRYPPWFDR